MFKIILERLALERLALLTEEQKDLDKKLVTVNNTIKIFETVPKEFYKNELIKLIQEFQEKCEICARYKSIQYEFGTNMKEITQIQYRDDCKQKLLDLIHEYWENYA